jgi:hypothetical protein
VQTQAILRNHIGGDDEREVQIPVANHRSDIVFAERARGMVGVDELRDNAERLFSFKRCDELFRGRMIAFIDHCLGNASGAGLLAIQSKPRTTLPLPTASNACHSFDWRAPMDACKLSECS